MQSFLSDKTDPPLPDFPYILATFRSDQSVGLKSVLLQVSLRSLAESLFLHFVCTPPCSKHGLWVVSYLWDREPVLGLLSRQLSTTA